MGAWVPIDVGEMGRVCAQMDEISDRRHGHFASTGVPFDDQRIIGAIVSPYR
jgi:hypothetical protein